jgi:hypothetical protein
MFLGSKVWEDMKHLLSRIAIILQSKLQSLMSPNKIQLFNVILARLKKVLLSLTKLTG